MRSQLSLLHAGGINGFNRRSDRVTRLGILICERSGDKAVWSLCRVVTEARTPLERQGAKKEVRAPWSRTVIKKVKIEPTFPTKTSHDRGTHYLEFREFNEQVTIELFTETLAARTHMI
jgi:hypothetical protein